MVGKGLMGHQSHEEHSLSKHLLYYCLGFQSSWLLMKVKADYRVFSASA